MREPPRLGFPRGKRWSWIALLSSLAIHGIVVVIWRVEGRLPSEVHRPPGQLILIPIQPDLPRAVYAPYFSARRSQGLGQLPGTAIPRPPEPRVITQVPKVIPSPSEPVDTTPAPPRAAIGRIRPDLGNGRLWVQPLPLPAQDLAKKLTRSKEELADSVVKATIQAFLDSIAMQPGGGQTKVPDWTTKVAGLKFGLDSANIYVAGLKIPAAVLALLPLPGGVNQQNALNHNGDFIYRDLREAARRSATMEDFKAAIKEIRERKEREREFEKAQRTAPDSTQN